MTAPGAFELLYSKLSSNLKGSSIGADVSRWEIDALYHFESGGKLRPYVSVGLGRAEYDFDVGPGDDDPFPSIGVGVKYDLSHRVALRGDVRVFNGSGLEEIERAASVGLVFVLGGSERPAPVKRAEPSEPAPMPVAVRIDSDGDGVFDDEDACPGTPAGTVVDRRGCALDDDRDGVPNSRDACPDTTNRQARIDETGCYVMLKEAVRIQLQVEFDFDSSAPPSRPPQGSRPTGQFLEGISPDFGRGRRPHGQQG
ncbi:MAG: thrombospondin type 3 repeat-containing protein [Proteobacteria bacterium]|nr:thrombospondin type 3 repeat-containing protein [Pseudomonadota bacterium]